jgi:hypothetical protein
MQEIAKAVFIFALKEFEHMTEGIPLDHEIINQLLWV